MASEFGDVRNLEAVRKSLHAAKPDIVLHLAAQALVRPSYADPLGTLQTNVMGTAHVLEAMRDLPDIRAAVIVTTDKCYQNQDWHWGYRESDPLGGSDPYSASKACAELVTSAYRQSFFSQQPTPSAIATARAGNVIGGGDWAHDRLIPDILRAFEQQTPVSLRYPHSVRPWQHVLEPLRGYLMLAQRLATDGASMASAWNFGPAEQDAWTVAQIADHMAGCHGEGAAWVSNEGPALHESRLLKLDTSLAQNILGWHPAWPLPQALKTVVEWHTRFLAGESARHLCHEQIRAYVDDVAGLITHRHSNAPLEPVHAD